jgi:hypothetical protein
LQATIIGFDVDQAVAAVRSLQGWAFRLGAVISAWAESWSQERTSFDASNTRISRSIPGPSPSQSEITADRASGLHEDESAHEPSFWAKLVSPPIIVFAVVVVAQISWRYAYRWKTGKLAKRRETSEPPDPGAASGSRPLPDRVMPWSKSTMVARPLFRKSRAS